MGQGAIDYIGVKGGLDINGIIEDYYVYAGANVNAGDFVEFVNGIASSTTETSSAVELSNQKYSAYSASAVALDNNRVFIAHNMDNSNYYLYGMVCTIEGATITAGIDTQLSTESLTGYTISTTLLKDGKVFIAHSYGSGNYYLYGMVCTINGTTITKGTDTSIYASSYGAYRVSTELLEDGEVFIAHSGNETNYYLYYTICSVSGTAISISKTTTLINSNERAGHVISTALIPNGNVFIAHGSSSFFMSGVIISKSGTTVTVGTTVQLSTQTYRAPGKLAVLDATRVFIPHSYTLSGYMMITIAKVSGTTISEYKSTEQITTTVNSGNTPRAVLMPSGKILVMHNISSLVYGMVCTVDDMTVTTGVDTNMSSLCRINGSTFLINNNIFVCEALYTTDYHLYAQLFNIDEINNTPTNQVLVREYETQVRPATSLPCNGVASTSGEGGDETGHKDIVSIYTVEQTLAMLPVGTLVKDPSSTFLGEPVIWKIADVNHEGYPSNSVTLISDKILAMRAFDTMEPNNSDSDRATAGNNRYSVSNIRQWLNSDAEAGQWYSAQHSADTPPSSSYAWNYGTNAYDTKAGFLNSFSQNFKNALLDTTLTVVLNTVTDGGGSENVIDKIFLASNTETGVSNENNIAEGSLLAVFSDNTSRKAYCTTEAINDSNYSGDPANDTTAWSWWLRTPSVGYSKYTRYITNAGAVAYDDSHASIRGVRPLCNIPSSIKVTQDEDGIYKLDF